jgi:hypothetical protein
MIMMDEAKLKEKLRLIEVLFAGAKTAGEKDAADRAKQRILGLKQARFFALEHLLISGTQSCFRAPQSLRGIGMPARSITVGANRRSRRPAQTGRIRDRRIQLAARAAAGEKFPRNHAMSQIRNLRQSRRPEW